ncbi:MAG TPA: F0F1 ATP synthase subunit A [Mycobacteriales bacterium]
MMPAANIEIGDHPHFTLGGLAFDLDTVIITVVVGAIIVGLGLYMARKAHSGVPSKLQLAFESIVDYVESQVSPSLKIRAPFVVPLAVTIFLFILGCNWVTLVVSGKEKEFIPPPTADVNLTYALGVFVIVLSWYKAIKVRGARSYFSHFVKPYAFLLPINIIEELIKPITLALRLFGNIFAGGVMLLIIALLPVYVLWAPNALWKIVDLGFVGPIQAFIFALLTIIYFSQAVAPDEEH